MSDVGTELSKDDVLDILSNSRRRYMIYYLHQQGGEVPLNDLASRIAAWENDTTVDQLSEDEQRRVYISLYQTHLPKLEQFGIVSYDNDERVATLTDRATEISRYLPADYDSPPWHLYYAALALVGVVLLGGIWLGIGPLAALSGTVVGLALALGFALVAAGQYVYERRRRVHSGFEHLIT